MTPDKLIFRLKGDDEHKVFSVRMKTNICDDLDRIATQTNRSRNDVLCCTGTTYLRNAGKGGTGGGKCGKGPILGGFAAGRPRYKGGMSQLF